MATYTSPIDRMLKRKLVDEDNCWVWPGSLNGNGIDIGGYGQVRDTETRTTLFVHRVSFEHYRGFAPPAGQVVDHLCHTSTCTSGPLCKHRKCWNPLHLTLTDFDANCARGNAPGQVTKRTGVCQRDHVLSEVGVYSGTRKSGTTYSRCRACDLLRQKARRLGCSVEELI